VRKQREGKKREWVYSILVDSSSSSLCAKKSSLKLKTLRELGASRFSAAWEQEENL
jgi:hypothetical protein